MNHLKPISSLDETLFKYHPVLEHIVNDIVRYVKPDDSITIRLTSGYLVIGKNIIEVCD
jgi:hypothetical protein